MERKRLRASALFGIIVVCFVLLSGCTSNSETQAEDVVDNAAQEAGLTNYFKEESVLVTFYRFESDSDTSEKLADVQMPASFQVIDARGVDADGVISLVDEDQNVMISDIVSDDLYETMASLTSITAKDGDSGDTLLYVQANSGTPINVEKLTSMYPEGQEFTYGEHTCYLLGPGTGYTGVRLGDLTVYYEIDSDTGTYLQLGYEGPLTELVDEMELAETLCAMVID